jgi:riboflavin synthase alpha subunit
MHLQQPSVKLGDSLATSHACSTIDRIAKNLVTVRALAETCQGNR